MATIKKGDLEAYTAVRCINPECEEVGVVYAAVPDDFWCQDDDEVPCPTCDELLVFHVPPVP